MKEERRKIIIWGSSNYQELFTLSGQRNMRARGSSGSRNLSLNIYSCVFFGIHRRTPISQQVNLRSKPHFAILSMMSMLLSPVFPKWNKMGYWHPTLVVLLRLKYAKLWVHAWNQNGLLSNLNSFIILVVSWYIIGQLYILDL